MGVRATTSLLIPGCDGRRCKGFVEMRIAEHLDTVILVHCSGISLAVVSYGEG
jgi:hypothetical protein